MNNTTTKKTIMELNIANASLFTPKFSKVRKANELLLGGVFGRDKIVFLDGKPSTTALSILVYILSILPKTTDGKIDRKKIEEYGVGFKYPELCRVLGIKSTAENRKMLFEELYRLSHIIYKYDEVEVIRDEKGRHTTTKMTSPMPRLFTIDFYGKKYDRTKKEAWKNFIFFDKLILDGLENGGYRLIPTQRFLSLELPTAKLIASFILVHNQTDFEIGMLKLAQRISISINTEYKTKQTIKIASNELKKQSLIKDFEFRKNEEGETIIKYIFR